MFSDSAASKSFARFATTLLSVTLSPKTGQPAPSGLKKSFCGSITTNAALPPSNANSALGRPSGSLMVIDHLSEVTIRDAATAP